MVDGATLPVVSRRREVGDASARSLLMTVLGEFVLPRGGPVWTSTLVDALGMLGVEERSARQALARTAAEGWLASQRHGRRARWLLTPPGRRLLSEGAERIYSFGTAVRPWDGRWLVVLVSVPEALRDLRHRLRTRLTWAGFGSPAPGVWVSPDPGREAEARLILDELGLSAEAMSLTARYSAIGSEASIVERAWDLAAVAQRYEAFVEEFGALRLSGDDEILCAQAWLVHEWRRFPFLDPQLPRELLPRRWSGTRAAKLFQRRHIEWNDRAQRRWDELAAVTPERGAPPVPARARR
jgi:phenylacetic acid degradation operon negative regulatory protein